MFHNLEDVSNFLRRTMFPLEGMAFDMNRTFKHRHATPYEMADVIDHLLATGKVIEL